MSSNRLTTYQFAPGNTVDGTRIEQAVRELCSRFEDVPPDCVERRWSCSSHVWGHSPPVYEAGPAPPANTSHSLPFLSETHVASTLQPPAATDYTNPSRIKSIGNTGRQRYMLETTTVASHPMVIGSLAVFAEASPAALPTTGYKNPWEVVATGDPTYDFSLQVCVQDAWDLENRRKLRQEALVYDFASDAFDFHPSGTALGAGLDTVLPPMNGVFEGKAVSVAPLILVPAGARVAFQWIIPRDNGILGNTTWGLYPWQMNVWNLCAQLWCPTTRGGK